jgi:FkbM family methyltransferase
VRLPIVAGPLRGRWWLAESRGKIVRILTGSHEKEQTRLMRSLIRPGATVLDVGAHTGYYTLLASTLVGSAGRVRAFEPDVRNARFLRRHMALNRCRNVVVEEVAVARGAGAMRFGAGRGSGTGRLREDGPVEVQTVGLDDYCARHGLRPDVIKVDVEGAEAQVFEGARATLQRDRPALLLSTHGPAVHAASLAVLADLGYGAEAVRGGGIDTADELLCQPVGAEAETESEGVRDER